MQDEFLCLISSSLDPVVSGDKGLLGGILEVLRSLYSTSAGNSNPWAHIFCCCFFFGFLFLTTLSSNIRRNQPFSSKNICFPKIFQSIGYRVTYFLVSDEWLISSIQCSVLYISINSLHHIIAVLSLLLEIKLLAF